MSTNTLNARSSQTGLGGAGAIGAAGGPIDALGGAVMRYGLVAILFYFGAFKFTEVEAQAIQPLVANSPLMSWLYAVAGVQAVSNMIGGAEIAIGILIALRSVAPKLSAIGSLMAAATFATTLTFLATTPGIWASVPGFPLPVPGGAGGFIMKDWFLLGASLWSAAEALRAGNGD